MHEHPPSGPIARRLLAAIQHSRSKEFSPQERQHIVRELERIQSEGPSEEEFLELRPEHALYVSVHNKAMDTLEFLQEEPSLARITARMNKTNEEYMPLGPPITTVASLKRVKPGPIETAFH